MEDDRTPSEINPNDRGYQSPGARYYGITDPPHKREDLHCDERDADELPSSIERLMLSSKVARLEGFALGSSEMIAIRFGGLEQRLTSVESVVPRMGDAIVALVEAVRDLGHRVDRLGGRLETLEDDVRDLECDVSERAYLVRE